MAWIDKAANFVKGGWDGLKKLWIEGSQKISNMAFDEDAFYDVVNNVAGKSGKGENGFVMLNEARDTMRDELDTLSLRLYNNKYNVSSQADLEKGFSNLYDEEFIKRAFNQQIYAAGKGKGLFVGDTYNGYDFSDMGKKLTAEQRETLLKDFRTDYDSRLDDIYTAYVPENIALSKDTKSWVEKVDGEVLGGDIVEKTTALVPTMPVRTGISGPTTPLLGGPVDTVGEAVRINEKAKDLNFNYGMQKKYVKENMGTLDFATSAESNLGGINKAINKSAHSKELEAYRTYLNDNLVPVPDKTGTWSAPDSIGEYFSKQSYDKSTVRQIESEYKRISRQIASGDPDHSGIGLWRFAKKHPAIATGVVMGTAWGVSEITDEDEF